MGVSVYAETTLCCSLDKKVLLILSLDKIKEGSSKNEKEIK